MGTHPIFESDFDCLTDYLNGEEKAESGIGCQNSKETEKTIGQ